MTPLLSILFLACLPDSLPGDGDGDGYTYAIDCDDADPNVGPAEEGEECDRTQDSAEPLDTNDRDYDGYSEAQGDCDDTDPNVSPTASDIAGDDIDQNCDGVDGTDIDGDGFASAVSGGGDCDDTTAAINPDATEISWNDIDEDCSGKDLHDYSQISAGSQHACGLDTQGGVRCWGYSSDFSDLGAYQEGPYSFVEAGAGSTCVIRPSNDELQCHGSLPSTTGTILIPDGYNYQSVALQKDPSSPYPVCAITTSDELECGGCAAVCNSTHGCYGCSEIPEGTFTQVIVGKSGACGISSNQELSCWGSGLAMTQAPTTGSYTSVGLSGNSGQYGCALDSAGALVCWGNFATNASPADDGAASGPFQQMSYSNERLCAIRSSDAGPGEPGELWCWNFMPEFVPSGLYTQVSVGFGYACALDEQGEAQCFLATSTSPEPEDYGLLDPP